MRVPSERPTIPPSPPPEPASEMRLVTRPRIETVTHETWARSITGALYVRLDAETLKRLPLDHRAGFLLSLMDGTLDLETVVEVSGMPRDEVLRIVRDLYDSGVVDLRH
jgi:hypothetical protein